MMMSIFFGLAMILMGWTTLNHVRSHGCMGDAFPWAWILGTLLNIGGAIIVIIGLICLAWEYL